jgi:hypothetical protein
MKTLNSRISAAVVSAFFILPSAFGQGNLTPPGAPGPTMKSLDQIEPRTPISSLPFTITNAGSYYVTTNLAGGASGGIIIDVGGVTLDLMGFELVGGTGVGVFVNTSGSARTNIAIRNGTIRQWSGNGIDATFAFGPQLENLRVSGNAIGIRTGDGSMVGGCTAFGNSSNGIVASVGCTIRDSLARKNGADGIQAGDGSEVRACIVTDNTGDGIEVANNCHVRDNTCYGNGFASGSGAGVHATGQNNRIDGNHVNSGDFGIRADVAGNLIIRNSARGNSTNYLFLDTQAFGPTNLVSGLVTNHPWANFSY